MDNKIKCPSCGHLFDVEEAISGKIEAHLKLEYEKKLAEQKDKLTLEMKTLESERQELQKQKDDQDKILKDRLAGMLAQEKTKIEKAAMESYEAKIVSLSEENEQRKTELKTLREKEVLLLRRENELKEKQEQMSICVEKEILERTKDIEEKARQKERDAFELEKVLLRKQIDDNKKLAEEMKRKAEQGSMQLQGEVQELALEELLSRVYPFDVIREVPKGIRGADSIQTVVNPLQQECGSIVYESKRTKHFANEWIDKLKQDQLTCKADVAVLVTETFPAGMTMFGERHGIWICGFHEVKSLSFVLREMLLRMHSIQMLQENIGDKKELIYRYLTGAEFVQTIKRIVENHHAMAMQLLSEKKAMAKIWGMREKQIWAVQENLSALFGSIKGIAGKELEETTLLQLPTEEAGE